MTKIELNEYQQTNIQCVPSKKFWEINIVLGDRYHFGENINYISKNDIYLLKKRYLSPKKTISNLKNVIEICALQTTMKIFSFQRYNEFSKRKQEILLP